MLSLPQLIYFNEVAKTLHFTKAADNLHIAQSGLSRAISSLESELGVPLFLRQRYKNVRLTAYGEALLPHVQRILSEIEESRDELEQMANPSGGKVRLIYSIFNGHRITKHCLQKLYHDNHDPSGNGGYPACVGTGDLTGDQARGHVDLPGGAPVSSCTGDFTGLPAGLPSVKREDDPACLPADTDMVRHARVLKDAPNDYDHIDVSIQINHGAISLPDEIATGSADLAISCYRPDDGSVNCQMIGMQQLYVTLPAYHPLAARAADQTYTASDNNHFKTGMPTSESNIKSLIPVADAPDETASSTENIKAVNIKKKKAISLEEIAGEKIILFSSSLSLYAWVMDAFAQSDLSPSFIDGFQDWSAIMMQVANGQGISILPRVDFESTDTVQIPLAGGFGHRPVYLLSPNDRKLTPAVRSFKNYFLDFCREHPELI